MKKVPFFIDVLSTFFYLGKIPFMSGTFGSLGAIPLGYLCTFLPFYAKCLVLLGVFFIGVWVSSRYSTITGTEDAGSIVIDEAAGLLLFYIVFPFKPVYIITGFILFRFFDILKPFPVSLFDKMKNGWGIMLDDIAAGVYAVGICFLIIKLISYFNIDINKYLSSIPLLSAFISSSTIQ